MIDSKRLATVIFDMGKKISQSEYSLICESIDDDRFTLNEFVLAYKKKDSLLENMFFTLKDGSRILLNEDTLNTINNLQMDKDLLIEYMSKSEENFQKAIREIINGIE